MGIKGLTRFITENSQFLKPFKLHDSFVVLDGDNLVFSLYYCNKINVIFGGDYNLYAGCVRKFFRMFFECKIKPIVVFDGGLDKSGRKMSTVLKRIKERLSSVKDIVQNKNHNKKVLPILAHDVFIGILNELNVAFVVCDYEADDLVVALANYYKCPVISADSDFYISDLHNGYIKSDWIAKTVTFDIDPDGKEYQYLNCSIYHIEEFLIYFPGIEKTVLPLFSTLMGNDYVEPSEFDSFFTHIQLPVEEKVTGLLDWLKGKSLTDAISEVLQHLSETRHVYIKSIVESTVASYDLSHCNLQHIINQKLNYIKCEFSFHSGLTTPCGNSLPLDFIMNYHSGHYSYLFSNIIVSHKSILVPQMDDLNSCSSYMCARYIRRVIYGILTRHDVDGDTCQNKNCLAPIVEYDRHEGTFEKELVEPIFDLEGIGALPKINELSCLSKEKAKSILLGVLGIDFDCVKNFPTEWQLFIGSVNYFLHNSVPCCTEEFLYALILNLIYCDIIKNNIYDDASKCCKSVQRNHVCSSIPCIVSKIRDSELLRAEKSLKTYLIKPSIKQDKALCPSILHSYSQLQSCISSAVMLNKLLGGCMKNPDIQKYFNGTFLYNLTKDISTWTNPQSFMPGILGKRTALSRIFTLLESKIRHNVPGHYILKNESSCKVQVKSARHFENFIEK